MRGMANITTASIVAVIDADLAEGFVRSHFLAIFHVR